MNGRMQEGLSVQNCLYSLVATFDPTFMSATGLAKQLEMLGNPALITIGHKVCRIWVPLNAADVRRIQADLVELPA